MIAGCPKVAIIPFVNLGADMDSEKTEYVLLSNMDSLPLIFFFKFSRDIVLLRRGVLVLLVFGY